MAQHEVIDSLHPVAVERFRAFSTSLLQDGDLSTVRPFESARSPLDQERARRLGNSKVGAWQSVHQYGFAVDFVPKPAGKWSWDFPKSSWERMARRAERFGLRAPIEWDPGHIVIPHWRDELIEWLRKTNFT